MPTLSRVAVDHVVVPGQHPDHIIDDQLGRIDTAKSSSQDENRTRSDRGEGKGVEDTKEILIIPTNVEFHGTTTSAAETPTDNIFNGLKRKVASAVEYFAPLTKKRRGVEDEGDGSSTTAVASNQVASFGSVANENIDDGRIKRGGKEYFIQPVGGASGNQHRSDNAQQKKTSPHPCRLPQNLRSGQR